MKLFYYDASCTNVHQPLIKTMIKCILSWVYSFLMYPILWLYNIKRSSKDYKYNVAICAIFKNEAKYFLEWIEYHRLIGVDHFYLYNNFSDDDYLEILASYIEQGVVTLIDWPIKYGQKQAYDDCLNKYKNEAEWLGFIDLDEFINPLKHDDIKRWLRNYSNYPCVMIYWKMFGTSGLISEQNEKLVLEQYTSSWKDYCDIGKSFVNTSYLYLDRNCIHYFIFKFKFWGFDIPIYPINEFKRFFFLGYHRVPMTVSSMNIQINHYWSKSYDNYLYKDFVKGDVRSQNCENLKKISDRFKNHELRNAGKDYSIQRFLILLKQQLLLVSNKTRTIE